MTSVNSSTSSSALEPETPAAAGCRLPASSSSELDTPLTRTAESPGAGLRGAEILHATNEGVATPPGATVGAHADRTAADVDAPSGLGNQLSSDALRMRLVCMLTGEGERPQASGESGGVPQATNGLILDALEAARSFWKARKNEIRSCCAPAKIDQEEIRGYLLADVLG